MSRIKTLFLDRDGTLVEEPEDEQIDEPGKIRLLPDVIPALCRLRDAGYRFVMVSNQDGLGTAAFPHEDFERCQSQILALFSSQGVKFDEVFICPHLPTDNCDCRKPRSGLLTRYLACTDLDLQRSAVIGDRSTDLELAHNIGIPGFLVGSHSKAHKRWTDLADELLQSARKSTIQRSTRETDITVTVMLDQAEPIDINTGIGFYDHMLEQIAKHGGFGLQLRCNGDLRVDEHHTVEDTAICLGQAIREALGNKLGIARYGFLLPMDESAAQVALDLSGRASFVFEGSFPRDTVGQLSTEMVAHFFRSLAESLGAALHISVRGENTHHMVEACFKAVGRALRQAVRVDGLSLPSTKGVL